MLDTLGRATPDQVTPSKNKVVFLIHFKPILRRAGMNGTRQTFFLKIKVQVKKKVVENSDHPF
ncbi:MAG: hypothetical protein AAF551_11505 [Bacteroidota bacterium]